MTDASLRAQDDQAAAVATAPRVTLDHIEQCIEHEVYFNAGDAACRTNQPDTAPMHLLTICVLTLRNGFTVTGTSACASPENYDKTLGQQIARRHAVEQVWALEGYALRERLWSGYNQGEIW